jgi:hypothetical protein
VPPRIDVSKDAHGEELPLLGGANGERRLARGQRRVAADVRLSPARVIVVGSLYGIRPNFPEAIYVTPQGVSASGATGWPNTNREDEAMVRAVMAEIEAEYCIDKVRYYSAGFSFGRAMAITTGCNMSDAFRGVTVLSGANFSGARCEMDPPERPVAYWASHGTMDSVIDLAYGHTARDYFVERNGCSMSTQPANPSPCVEYDGCDDGYPVVWCEVPSPTSPVPRPHPSPPNPPVPKTNPKAPPRPPPANPTPPTSYDTPSKCLSPPPSLPPSPYPPPPNTPSADKAPTQNYSRAKEKRS